MSIIRPPVTGEAIMDAWMDAVSKGVTTSTNLAVSASNAASGAATKPFNAVTLVLYKRPLCIHIASGTRHRCRDCV